VEHRVVCISASDGSRGEDVAPLVAGRLGFQLVNEQIVARAAEEAGVTAAVAAGVEQRKSLVARLLEEMPAGAAGAAALGGYVALPEEAGPSADALRGLIRSAIEEIAARGDAVIMAHAASLALTGRDGALRVFVTASADTRRDRLAEARELTSKKAEKLLARLDANRADYLKRFYHVGSELPTHFDLVVNTDRLGPEQAAEVIVHAVRG
jgi:Cytidylate kinase-like family